MVLGAARALVPRLPPTDTAIRYYGLALQATPDDPQILARMGYELVHAGRKRDALAMFDRAVAITPAWAEVQFGRAMLLQETDDHEAALAAFDLALAVNPDHDRALYGLALSLIALQRLDDAVAPLERNTKLQPMSPYGWYQLARVQFDRGKPDKTQRHPGPPRHVRAQDRARRLARETGLQGAAEALTPGRRHRAPRRSAGRAVRLNGLVAAGRKLFILRAVCRHAPATPAATARAPTRAPRRPGDVGNAASAVVRLGGACHAVDREAPGVLEQESPYHRRSCWPSGSSSRSSSATSRANWPSTSSAGRSRSGWGRRDR